MKIKVRDYSANRKGIALVEVIAALGIAIVVLTALVSLTLFTTRSSLNSRLLLQGTKTATREAELVRSFRDSSAAWVDFVTAMVGCLSSCHMDQLTGSPAANPISEGTPPESVTRSFTASNPAGGALVANSDQVVKLNITASWTVGGVVKSTHLYTNLANWR